MLFETLTFFLRRKFSAAVQLAKDLFCIGAISVMVSLETLMFLKLALYYLSNIFILMFISRTSNFNRKLIIQQIVYVKRLTADSCPSEILCFVFFVVVAVFLRTSFVRPIVIIIVPIRQNHSIAFNYCSILSFVRTKATETAISNLQLTDLTF